MIFMKVATIVVTKYSLDFKSHFSCMNRSKPKELVADSLRLHKSLPSYDLFSLL